MKIVYILIFSFILLFSALSLRAKTFRTEDTAFIPKTLTEAIIHTSRQCDFLKVSLNTRTAFHASRSGENDSRNAFRLDYLRLQVTGNITDRIYYKWLQHLNRNNSPKSLDNTPSSIDCIGVGFHITPTLSSFIGKQYADYGGFEYDADPAEVYEYSDLGEYITCFLVGINLAWKIVPTQEIRLQIVNANAGRISDTYPAFPENFQAAKTPLGYTVNWNGSFLKERLLTRCSFSLFHEGRKENVYFLALAGAWLQERFNIYVDAMYSMEDIDKLGILSDFLLTSDSSCYLSNAGYFSLVSRANYRIWPKLNIFVKGMYETASLRKNTEGFAKGKYRTSIGYQGGIEYFPMKENLRFYLLYHGRHRNYTRIAGDSTTKHENTQTVSLGLIYNIPVF